MRTLIAGTQIRPDARGRTMKQRWSATLGVDELHHATRVAVAIMTPLGASVVRPTSAHCESVRREATAERQAAFGIKSRSATLSKRLLRHYLSQRRHSRRSVTSRMKEQGVKRPAIRLLTRAVLLLRG